MSEVGRYWYNGGLASLQNCDPTAGTAKVGSYKPNNWGLYDMHGNVSEWCLDWYNSSYGTAAVSDPVGPNTGSFHVYRGGNVTTFARQTRSAWRSDNAPSYINSAYGFRVAYLPLVQ